MTDLREIERFLFEEAQLLDERRFEEWLKLFDADAHYYMPCRPDAERSKRHSAYIDEDTRGLSLRVSRLRLPNAHTETPAPTGARVLSNIVLESQDPLQVRAKFVMHEFQRRDYGRDDFRTFCGTVRYGLRLDGGTWRIRFKHVHLVDAGGSPTVMATPI